MRVKCVRLQRVSAAAATTGTAVWHPIQGKIDVAFRTTDYGEFILLLVNYLFQFVNRHEFRSTFVDRFAVFRLNFAVFRRLSRLLGN